MRSHPVFENLPPSTRDKLDHINLCMSPKHLLESTSSKMFRVEFKYLILDNESFVSEVDVFIKESSTPFDQRKEITRCDVSH
jgi:hypothetical protein